MHINNNTFPTLIINKVSGVMPQYCIVFHCTLRIMSLYNGCVAQRPYYDRTCYQPNTVLVQPFALTKGRFAKKYFLLYLTPVKQK